jgi:hypothetical protein
MTTVGRATMPTAMGVSPSALVMHGWDLALPPTNRLTPSARIVWTSPPGWRRRAGVRAGIFGPIVDAGRRPDLDRALGLGVATPRAPSGDVSPGLDCSPASVTRSASIRATSDWSRTPLVAVPWDVLQRGAAEAASDSPPTSIGTPRRGQSGRSSRGTCVARPAAAPRVRNRNAPGRNRSEGAPVEDAVPGPASGRQSGDGRGQAGMPRSCARAPRR